MMGYGPDWGMMGGWSGWGWTGPFHMIGWLLILVLIIAAVAWFVRSATSTYGDIHPSHTDRRSSGLGVLEERYARGEINRDEYLQKKRDIVG